MLQFIFGFSIGIYIGSYYNCKPQVEELIKIIKEKMPEPTTEKPPEPKTNKETVIDFFRSSK